MVRIIAKSLGIPSFLNDWTTSCIGEVDERITIAVKQTINLANKRTVQFKPASVMNNHEYGPCQMIFPGCMNGWNAMTKPPKGKRRSTLLKLSLKDNFAKNMTINKKHSNTIGTISLSEKTQKRIISKMATSLT